MTKKKRIGLILAAVVIVVGALTAFLLIREKNRSDNSLKDGYYTAQAKEFNFGWKEYITILVKDGEIVSVEYNAENASYFVKSWDNSYMTTMLASDGTYPNEYTRNYAAQLLENQGPDGCDALTGATSSFASFQILSAAVLEQARLGDSTVAIVDTSSGSSH